MHDFTWVEDGSQAAYNYIFFYGNVSANYQFGTGFLSYIRE